MGRAEPQILKIGVCNTLSSCPDYFPEGLQNEMSSFCKFMNQAASLGCVDQEEVTEIDSEIFFSLFSWRMCQVLTIWDAWPWLGA